MTQAGSSGADAFIEDIRTNLEEWNVIGEVYLYRTTDYWYECNVVDVRGDKFLVMQRHRNGAVGAKPEREVVEVANAPIGKSFLTEAGNRHKRVHYGAPASSA